MENLDLRILMMLKDVKGREVAKLLGVDASNFSKLLNDQNLSDEWRRDIQNAILQIADSKGGDSV